TFHVASTTRTPAQQPSAPAAKPEAPRKAMGGIVKRVTVPQQIIDFVNTRIQNEGVCALAILLLQDIQSPEDQRLRAQAFIPLLQSRLEVLKNMPEPAQTTSRLSGAQEKATAEALLKALGISQLAPQRSEAIELSRRSAEVNRRADVALKQYEAVQGKLQTPPAEAGEEYKILERQLQAPMRVLASLSHADFGSRGDIEGALEKIV